MQKPLLTQEVLQLGELYLFHPTKPLGPEGESLWGIVGEIEEQCIVLESCTINQRDFGFNQPLSPHFSYARRASRTELRDYAYNLALGDLNRQRQALLLHKSPPVEP